VFRIRKQNRIKQIVINWFFNSLFRYV